MKISAITSAIVAGSLLAASAVQAADALSPQDHMEIQQLYARYNVLIDRGDAEGWASTFTPDGQFNQFVGRESLIKFVKGVHERTGGQRRHWNSNLIVAGDSRKAQGSVYLMWLDVGTKPATVFTTAIYTDELVRTADGWRFSKRQTKPDQPPAAAQAPAAGTGAAR
jgi:hypothetical protein